MTATVLYIEDNLDNLMLVRRILRATGYHLIEATTAKDGIRLAEERLPDLILMDINMPEMDGLAATSYLRQIPDLEDVPIVALTANVMRDILQETLAAGCDGYILKPIDIDEFPAQIQGFLGNGHE